MIQDQIDRIEHETGEKTAGIKTQEETHHQKHTVSIVAISKWKVYPVLSLKMTVKIGKN